MSPPIDAAAAVPCPLCGSARMTVSRSSDDALVLGARTGVEVIAVRVEVTCDGCRRVVYRRTETAAGVVEWSAPRTAVVDEGRWLEVE